MSNARLAITGVTVEKRPVSQVARAHSVVGAIVAAWPAIALDYAVRGRDG